MNEKEKALAKIQKCLRLANSTNPHEAAQALKQAYALMRKHNISEGVAIDCGDITIGSELNATNTNKIPEWLNHLVNVIQDTFSVVATCRTYSGSNYYGSRTTYKSTIKFHGERSDVIIAEYAFNFLLRLLRKSRSEYSSQLSSFKRNRTKLADQYAQGWCIGVNNALRDLRRFNPDEQKKQREKINNYINTVHGDLDTKKITKQTATDMTSLRAGFNDGQKVEINRGINTTEQTYLEDKTA
ncbi:MAG: DUF2786 domain-containing protein [Burkholderiales bacterium]|nr:DUF2786 domain-containing protein [Burkholderiales bacterium]